MGKKNLAIMFVLLVFIVVLSQIVLSACRDFMSCGTGRCAVKKSENCIPVNAGNAGTCCKCVACGCDEKTCSDLDKECGAWGDGCGKTITCGNKGNCTNPLDVCTSTGQCCYPLTTVCSGNDQCCSNSCQPTKISGGGLSTISWSGLVTENICCRNTQIRGYGSQCINVSSNPGTAAATGYNGNDSYAAPLADGWLDCDSSANAATTYCSNVCKGGWLNLAGLKGESCGTYGGECSAPEPGYGCCGDDSAEFPKQSTSGSYKCCPKPDDCVSSSGQCVPAGTYEGDRICSSCGWSKVNFDATKIGCCEEESQCLVNPDTSACVVSGEYFLDKLCEEGIWSSRTRIIAASMQKSQLDANKDFVIFCDSYDRSLNYYDYPLGDYLATRMFLMSSEMCGDHPCFNNFCVLIDSSGALKSIGSSLNPNTDGAYDPGNIYTMLNLKQAICDTTSSSGLFEDCGEGLSYNAEIKAFIFTKRGDEGFFQSIGNALSTFWNMIKTPFLNLFSSTPKAAGFRTSDFSRIYLLKMGEKEVFAVQDNIYRGERVFINYTNFDTDFCSTLQYQISKAGSCSTVGDSQYIYANRTLGENNLIIDNWAELTAGLRVGRDN